MENDSSWGCVDATGADIGHLPGPLGLPGSTSSVDHDGSDARPLECSVPRLGRLSPATIQMILSPNTSVVSGISSAADTSYDSGLYQWLGVETTQDVHSKALASSSFEMDNSDSRDASSQLSSSKSPIQYNLNIPPLSPPPTVRPPFTDTLMKERMLSCPPGPGTISSTVSNHGYEQDSDFSVFHSYSTYMLSNNISLQHYMPSCSVLRHFQEVVDELRGLYLPNDLRNNVPRWDIKPPTLTKERTMISTHPLPVLDRCFSSHCPSLREPSVSVTGTPTHEPSQSSDRRASRVVRELYTEMAVLLFGQAAQEEEQLKDLQNIVSRLETVANRTRQIALIIGTRGIGKKWIGQ
ncbi:hypothetical protein K439DRAFT_1610284 [Ramaria rubella]|nr:hypothetical protein K439DRAFT_1610284 [Ramaria rubella]